MCQAIILSNLRGNITIIRRYCIVNILLLLRHYVTMYKVIREVNPYGNSTERASSSWFRGTSRVVEVDVSRRCEACDRLDRSQTYSLRRGRKRCSRSRSMDGWCRTLWRSGTTSEADASGGSHSAGI